MYILKEFMRSTYFNAFLILLLLPTAATVRAQVVPLPHAHAHNDYKHQQPLLDALSHGFTSIEADVLLIDGELYVGHDMPTSEHSLPTLRSAYLEPLARIVHNHRGEVYPYYGGDFYLMIDIKTEAEATYQVLKEHLADYQHILTRYENGNYTHGAVTVFLSGNRPISTIQKENQRLTGVDGRPEDLGSSHSAELMPVISENYSKVIRWNGKGEIPAADLQKIKQLVTRTHAEGKKLRLWAIPDQKNAWATLQEAGIDLINTDDLPGLKAFLLEGYASH